jgi:hypothetical protein
LLLLTLTACGGGSGNGLPTSNVAPVANAGSTQNVFIGSTVILDASTSTDNNGDQLTYKWVLASKPDGSKAALSSTTAVKPTFVADLAGSYVFSLIVNDGKIDSPPTTVTITAAVANIAPVANAGTAQSVSTGSQVTLDGSSSSDANGDALTYSWTITSKPPLSTANLTGATNAKPTFTADYSGSYVISLIVSDGRLSSTTATVTITAAAANVAPVANAGNAQTVSAGSSVLLDGSFSSDANGDSLVYTWSITSKPTGSTAALSDVAAIKPTITADKAGTYVIQLIVFDGKAISSPATVTITATVANVAPVANAGNAQTVSVGANVLLDGRFSSDANGDSLVYTWSIISKPTGSTAALSDVAAIKPTITADKAGTYVIQLIVFDGKAISSPATVTITAFANIAPVANAGSAQTVSIGAIVLLDGRGSSDANGDSLIYDWTLTSKPTNSSATLNDLSGATTARPNFTADVAGTYVATLVVFDGKFYSTPATVIITVTQPGTSPSTFTFTDEVNVPLSKLIESLQIRVQGINTAVPISVVGGEYQIDVGAWTAAAGFVTNGQNVRVRHVSSANTGTATNTTLTIGGVSDTFTTTTIGYLQQGGLTWVPNMRSGANDLNLGDGRGYWSTANDRCNTATFNGQTGWRLPNKDELVSLANSKAMLNLPGWTLSSTWSSTSDGLSKHYEVYLENGSSLLSSDSMLNYVTCVR